MNPQCHTVQCENEATHVISIRGAEYREVCYSCASKALSNRAIGPVNVVGLVSEMHPDLTVTTFGFPFSSFTDGMDDDERSEWATPSVWSRSDLIRPNSILFVLKAQQERPDFRDWHGYSVWEVDGMTVLAATDRDGHVMDSVVCFEWDGPRSLFCHSCKAPASRMAILATGPESTATVPVCEDHSYDTRLWGSWPLVHPTPEGATWSECMTCKDVTKGDGVWNASVVYCRHCVAAERHLPKLAEFDDVLAVAPFGDLKLTGTVVGAGDGWLEVEVEMVFRRARRQYDHPLAGKRFTFDRANVTLI